MEVEKCRMNGSYDPKTGDLEVYEWSYRFIIRR